MLVTGVDGWKNGWVGVDLLDGRFERAWLADAAASVVATTAEVIAIDIPLGLAESGSRPCDRAAKQLLGRRASSLFLTPPRSVIEAAPYATANALCKDRYGFGVSRQAYGLRAKVLAMDAIGDDRLHEVHPELSFRALAGDVLPSKRTWAGVERRREALAAVGIILPMELGEASQVPVDDVLDAAAAAWTAHRIATGEASVVPSEVLRDERGRRMAIWY